MNQVSREYMTQKELVADFNSRYSKHKNRKWLDGIADKNVRLVNRLILGAEKNPFYGQGIGPITRKDNEYYALVDWILPKKQYKYSEVSWDTYCQLWELEARTLRIIPGVSRSSIIPVVKIDGVNYWMLANFHDYENSGDPILMDFGGACEPDDALASACPSLSCAFRELAEESKVLLNSYVREAIDAGNIAIIEGTNYNWQKQKEEKINFLFVELDYEKVKDIPEVFSTLPNPKNKEGRSENLGQLGFYKQKDIRAHKYRTSKNLTDFISFLNQ